ATASIGRSPARARSAALRRSHARAAADASTAYTRACGRACAMDSASAPVPLPRSTTTDAGWATAHCAKSSVSGRGMKTPGPTASSSSPNPTVPVRCCSGTRSARRATSSWNRAAAGGGNVSTSANRPRGTPSTWAASCSASARGDATPDRSSSATARASALRTGFTPAMMSPHLLRGDAGHRPAMHSGERLRISTQGAVQPRTGHRIMETLRPASPKPPGGTTRSSVETEATLPVRWLDRCGDEAAAVTTIHELLVDDRSAAALRAAERATRTVTNPYARASAHLSRVGAMVNLGRITQYATAVDEAFAAVQALTDPYPHGHLHAL